MNKLLAIFCFTFFTINSFAEGVSSSSPLNNKVFDDWAIKCGSVDKSQEDKCFTYQNLKMKGQDKIVMHIAIGYPASNDTPFALFTLPLGVALTPGVGLKVADDEIYPGAFQRCLSTGGCTAIISLGEGRLKKLTSSKEAIVYFAFNEKKPVAVPISVKGLEEAFSKIKK